MDSELRILEHQSDPIRYLSALRKVDYVLFLRKAHQWLTETYPTDIYLINQHEHRDGGVRRGSQRSQRPGFTFRMVLSQKTPEIEEFPVYSYPLVDASGEDGPIDVERIQTGIDHRHRIVKHPYEHHLFSEIVAHQFEVALKNPVYYEPSDPEKCATYTVAYGTEIVWLTPDRYLPDALRGKDPNIADTLGLDVSRISQDQ